ncbi:UNVERIFIED_CONTAM: hypothetical protein FKN15_077436 [Acipenser sinensis]
MCHQPHTSLHAADSPCSRLRATASEDNAALGILQASPQAPGQTTGVAGRSSGAVTVISQGGLCSFRSPAEEALYKTGVLLLGSLDLLMLSYPVDK